MLIKDILNYRLITCNIKSTIKDVSRLMLENDIGFIPVTKDNDIVGVITDRDIVLRAIAQDINSIEDIMTHGITYIDSSKEIKDALDYLAKNKIKRILIKENNNYVGVLTICDIIKHNYDEFEIIATLKEIIKPDIEEKNVEVDTFEL